MTEIAREFLEDVNVGDYIRIRYGTDSNQETVEGTVKSISENFLKLQKKDGGTSKIRLDDSLRSLDVIVAGDGDNSESTPAPKVIQQEAPSPKVEVKSDGRINRHFVSLEPPLQYNFVIKDQIKNIRLAMKNVSNKILLSELSSVLNSLDSAIKNNQVDYKYHDLRAKVLRTWEICNSDEDYELFYFFIGILAVVSKDYDYALEPLVRARRYSIAAYSASANNRKDETDIFKFCSLLSKQENRIDQYVAQTCINRRDADVLKELLEYNKFDSDMCEKIATCANMIFTTSKGQLTSSVDSSQSAYDAAKQLLDSVPESWKNESEILERWQEYQQYKYPEAEVSNAHQAGSQLVGKIYRYENAIGKNWGFISPGHYFYIKQVYDNSERGILLRKMLYAGLWNQLEVSFRLGESSNRVHQSAASHIELTDLGYEEAMRRLEDGQTSEKTYNGFVEIFYGFPYMNGRIQAEEDGEQYKFTVDNIIDPWLKAYYEHINDYSSQYQDVSFEILGKDKAINICWRNPPEHHRELYAEYISDDDLYKWNIYLDSRNNKGRRIALPNEDPYQSYFYVALPEWEEKDTNNKIQPFTWKNNKSSIEVPANSSNKAVEVSKGREEKTVDVVSEQKENIPMVERIHKAAFYADRARKARLIDGKWEEAELDFERSLEIGGFNESTVCDLIYVYSRLENFDKAIKLMNKYESELPKEKLLNLQIGLYSKKKDYKILSSLYEEALRTSTTVSKKSHNLFCLIGTYINLQDYEEALRICQRWDSFYKQNLLSPDLGKLKNTLPAINRKRAICYYYLNNIEEAQRLARDLIKINPLDDVANKILDGTLTLEVDETNKPATKPVKEELDASLTRFAYGF